MMIRRAVVLGWLAAVLTVAGCQDPQSSELTQWSTAVSAAKDQSESTFAAVNTLVREQEVVYAAAQANINAAMFKPGLEDEALRAWRAALDTLSTYSDNVAKLADPSGTAGTGESAAGLAKSIAARAKLDSFNKHPGLADAIAKIGNAIASSAARASAQSIIRRADPGVQDLLSSMGTMLSDTRATTDASGRVTESTEVGVIPTVESNWDTRLGELQAAFLAPGADKKAIAGQFADALGQKQASIATLRALKSSLADLARAHGDLASGKPADTATVLAQIKDYTKLAKGILDDLKKTPAAAAH